MRTYGLALLAVALLAALVRGGAWTIEAHPCIAIGAFVGLAIIFLGVAAVALAAIAIATDE